MQRIHSGVIFATLVFLTDQTGSINVAVWQRYGLLSPAVLSLQETD